MIGKCIHEDVLITAALFGDNPSADEHTLVELLVAQGYEVLQAELLVVFVPLGLGRPVIAQLHADPPIRLSETALIRDFVRDRTLEVRLTDVPEFVVASELGEQHYQTGIISREHFSAAAGFSVELKLISMLLNSDEEIGGAEMSPPILLRLADTEAFEEWYREIKPKNIFQRCIAKLKGSLQSASLW